MKLITLYSCLPIERFNDSSHMGKVSQCGKQLEQLCIRRCANYDQTAVLCSVLSVPRSVEMSYWDGAMMYHRSVDDLPLNVGLAQVRPSTS